MNSTDMLTILRDFLMALGGFSVLWGFYDMWGDGQQNSVGLKKLIGGIAFAALAYFIITANMKQISAAESKAGISACYNLPVIVHRMTGLIR
jgi:hypothetical protein